jgi:hypothetical protein
MSLDGILEELREWASSGIVHFKKFRHSVLSASTLSRDTKTYDRVIEDQTVIETEPLGCVGEV